MSGEHKKFKKWLAEFRKLTIKHCCWNTKGIDGSTFKPYFDEGYAPFDALQEEMGASN